MGYAVDNQLYAVAHGNGRFVAVGGHAEGKGVILASDDGAAWTQVITNYPAGLKDVAFGDGMFVACGDNGHTVYSTDGLNWTTQLAPLAIYDGICHGQGRFLTVARYGKIAQSGPVNSPDGPGIYANGERVAVTVPASAPVTITATLHPGQYAGYNADHWVVAIPLAGPQWYCLDADMQWFALPAGAVAACRPVYSGALRQMDDPVTLLPATRLAAGVYDVYFGVDEMDGIMHYNGGRMLSDKVRVTVE